MRPIHAVLTGDLVASAESTPKSVDEAVHALQAAADQVRLWTGHDTHFSRFRGDGWQLYLDAPGLSLAAVISLVATLRARRTGLETRIAVGFGTINQLGDRRKGLADASGEAFPCRAEHSTRCRATGKSSCRDQPWCGAGTRPSLTWPCGSPEDGRRNRPKP